MKHKYIEYLKKHHNIQTAIALEVLMMNGYTDEIQHVLNGLGERLIVDGILGFKTLVALDRHNTPEFWKGLENYINRITTRENNAPEEKRKRYKNAQRQIIMNFLFHWEGKDIAWLHGEKSVTAPLGVYCHAMPRSGPCTYIKTLYRKYGLNYRSVSHARLLNKKVSSAERNRLFELAWAHYKATYLGKGVASILESYPKSSLSYFSNSINGGKRRGDKTLQEAIGAKPDGKIGPRSIAQLKAYLAEESDNSLSQGILGAMKRFYCYLATRSKKAKHYRQFIRGWINRIVSLGYTGRKSC